MMRSGAPSVADACQTLSEGHWRGVGISLGLPSGAPASAQRTMMSICSSEREISFLNFCTPTVRSMCQGGIWREMTRWRIDLAQGRFVVSDKGHRCHGTLPVALLT